MNEYMYLWGVCEIWKEFFLKIYKISQRQSELWSLCHAKRTIQFILKDKSEVVLLWICKYFKIYLHIFMNSSKTVKEANIFMCRSIWNYCFYYRCYYHNQCFTRQRHQQWVGRYYMNIMICNRNILLAFLLQYAPLLVTIQQPIVLTVCWGWKGGVWITSPLSLSVSVNSVRCK